MADKFTLPPHVPTELVVDVDFYNMPGAVVDPQLAWRIFSGKGPLVYSPRNGGHWVATNGADVFRFLRATEIFSSAQIVLPNPGPSRFLPAQSDPPEHGKYRANIMPLFSPKAIESIDGNVRSLTISLIDAFVGEGECEFVSQFALQLPLRIFLHIMGLPASDLKLLRGLVEDFITSPEIASKTAALSGITEYLTGAIDYRRKNPGSDGVSRIIGSTIDGRPYSEEEVISTLTLLLFAGLDTVAMMLSFITLHLARHPADRLYIRENPSRMGGIVQELLRRYTGSNVARVLAVDYCHEGVILKRGDRILLSPTFFNMNEDTLERPDEVDFTRSPRHITFGAGPHTCAGAILARREVTIFLEEWLTRIPDFKVDGARPPIMSASQQNAITSLWLKWDVPIDQSGKREEALG